MNMKTIINKDYLEQKLRENNFEDFFSGYEKYKKYFSLMRAEKNEMLFDYEISKKYLYFLISGKVKVFTQMYNGKKLIMDIHSDFVMFGDFDFFDVEIHENYFYTEVFEDAEFLVLQIDTIKDELLDDVKFLRILCKCLIKKFDHLRTVQPMNILHSSEQNLARHILNFLSEKDIFDENLKDTSEVIGISYRHLHRLLHKFVEKGILQREIKGYSVTNLEELKNIIRN